MFRQTSESTCLSDNPKDLVGVDILQVMFSSVLLISLYGCYTYFLLWLICLLDLTKLFNKNRVENFLRLQSRNV